MDWREAAARSDDRAVSAEEVEAVAQLLGRPPMGGFSVAVRRRDGSPVVIENEPFLDDGRPMPTRFWLVDQQLRAAVSRIEAGGGVRLAEAEVDRRELSDAHARYAAEREQLLERTGARLRTGVVGWPTGGVGGARGGVKCLHAHLAWYLAGGDDPVGHWVAERLDREQLEGAGLLVP